MSSISSSSAISRSVALLVVWSVAACVDAGVYRCGADEECTLDDVQGACELDDPTLEPSDQNRGVCAFPDASCNSGRRYGEFAGDRKNSCVAAVCGNGIRESGEECDAAVPHCIGCVARCDGQGERKHAATLHCYMAGPGLSPLSWTEARNACQQWGGDLAVVTSAEEIVFAIELAPPGAPYFWVGGRRIRAGWEWINGEPWFDGFAEPEPDGQGTLGPADCVGVRPTAEAFGDESCGEQSYYLCERAP